MSHISRREARRLKKRVEELEKILDEQKRSWAREWPGGVHLGTIDCTHKDYDTKVLVARKLGHAVVLTHHNTDKLEMYALPLPVKP
jgi:hypothetical protein